MKKGRGGCHDAGARLYNLPAVGCNGTIALLRRKFDQVRSLGAKKSPERSQPGAFESLLVRFHPLALAFGLLCKVAQSRVMLPAILSIRHVSEKSRTKCQFSRLAIRSLDQGRLFAEINNAVGTVELINPNDTGVEELTLYDIKFPFGTRTLYGTQIDPA